MPEEYGGQGLSQTGYCRVSEVFAQIDPTLSVIMGVHQSIGLKPIELYGSDEQKERFLPDLATGRKLAAFALTEPNAGSDVNGIETIATPQADGSLVLNGEKRYIGNGSKASVLSTFARIEDTDDLIALVIESDMEGFEVGHRYDTMGLRANDLRHLHFNDVRVPKENVLGEPGDGFKIAMHTLNNGRMSLGTGSVGGTKILLDKVIDHVKERRQFGMSLAEFELVQDKIGWMVSYLFGLEAMAYLTTGLVDAGVPDYSLESAIVKVASTEFLWYGTNRALQLKGGAGYMRDEPYEKVLRDTRIFPIFEGANDVMRAFIALSGMKPVGEKLEGLGDLDWALADRLDRGARRVRRRADPARGAPGPDHAGPRGAEAARRRRLRPGQGAARRVGESCCASTARGSWSGSSSRSASRTRCPTSTRRSRCSHASPRSSTSTASSRPARSATSPRRSARARRGGCARTSTRSSRTTTTG